MVIKEDNEDETVKQRLQSLFFETKNAMIDNRFRAIVDRRDCCRMPDGISPGFRDLGLILVLGSWIITNSCPLRARMRKKNRARLGKRASLGNQRTSSRSFRDGLSREDKVKKLRDKLDLIEFPRDFPS